MEEKLFTTQQAAAQLGISDARLRELKRQGRAQPKIMIGGTWMYTLEEVRRLESRPRYQGHRAKQKRS